MKYCKICMDDLVDDVNRYSVRQGRLCIPCVLYRNNKYYIKNRDKVKQTMADYATKNKDKNRSRYLKRKYDIDNDYYNKQYIKQQGMCCICNKYEVVLKIDHDHATGKLRGLLCNVCNLSLGGFVDNIEILKSAIKYLKKYKGK